MVHGALLFFKCVGGAEEFHQGFNSVFGAESV